MAAVLLVRGGHLGYSTKKHKRSHSEVSSPHSCPSASMCKCGMCRVLSLERKYQGASRAGLVEVLQGRLEQHTHVSY